MSIEFKADVCIVGGGTAGLILASRLASTGKTILVVEQGPTFSEADRTAMLTQARQQLNDYADYNDDLQSSSSSPHTSAASDPENRIFEWKHQRLFGVGGTALHFEGVMLRPVEDDLHSQSKFSYSRDWPIQYKELEPWLLEAEKETAVSDNADNPYSSSRSGPFPMPALAFSYFDKEIYVPALHKLGMVGHSLSTSSSIDLAAFSTDEKEVLLRFVQHFYSYLEIRNQLSGEPVFGECPADPLFYTRLI